MKKVEALKLLGGSVKTASEATGLTTQAIYLWPETLSDAQEGKVMLALARGAPKPRGSKSTGKVVGKSRARNKRARVA